MMRPMSWRRGHGRVLVAAIALALAAACGSGADGGTDAGGTGAGGDPQQQPQGSDFTGISDVVGAEGSTLDVMTDPLPADATAPGCRVEATPRVQETPSEVIVYLDLAGDHPTQFEGCDPAPQAMTLTLAAPIAERYVSDAFGGRWWQADGGWVGCDAVVMTCITEPASCDNGTLRATVANDDVPRHFGMDERCEEPFAVTDVDIGAGSCPVTGEPENPCAGERIRRIYWRIVDDAWASQGIDQGPGCGDILATVPDFPPHLCADLPALEGGGD